MADEPATTVDDDEIALLLMEGSKGGVRLLLQVHGPRVRGFLRKYFPAQADDALQEALKNVLFSMDTFDESKDRLSAWFLTIARNAALDLIRCEKKHRHVGYDDGEVAALEWNDLAEPEHDSGVYDPQELDRDRTVLMEILDTLAPLQRKILMRDAAHRDGVVPAAELADEFGSTAASIRANRAKAWKAVDDQLRMRGLPPRRRL